MNAKELKKKMGLDSLSGADLREADLRGADLRGADLQSADLRGADLYGADLRGSSLYEAKLPPFQIPQDETLTVWKKAQGILIKLEIPAEAKRTAVLIGRKCRAEFAKVLDFESSCKDSICSNFDDTCIYKIGELVFPDSYDDDIRVECTHGIHFFLTKQEAENDE